MLATRKQIHLEFCTSISAYLPICGPYDVILIAGEYAVWSLLNPSVWIPSKISLFHLNVEMNASSIALERIIKPPPVHMQWKLTSNFSDLFYNCNFGQVFICPASAFEAGRTFIKQHSSSNIVWNVVGHSQMSGMLIIYNVSAVENLREGKLMLHVTDESERDIKAIHKSFQDKLFAKPSLISKDVYTTPSIAVIKTEEQRRRERDSLYSWWISKGSIDIEPKLQVTLERSTWILDTAYIRRWPVRSTSTVKFYHCKEKSRSRMVKFVNPPAGLYHLEKAIALYMISKQPCPLHFRSTAEFQDAIDAAEFHKFYNHLTLYFKIQIQFKGLKYFYWSQFSEIFEPFDLQYL